MPAHLRTCRPPRARGMLTEVMLIGIVPAGLLGYGLSALLMRRRTQAVLRAFRCGAQMHAPAGSRHMPTT